MNVSAKFEICSLAVPQIIAVKDLGAGCEPQSSGTRGRRGSGEVPFERALVTSYRPYMVTFPLFSRASEILSLLCSAGHFPPHV